MTGPRVRLPAAPWLLVLAGHDPTRGAGIHADVEAAAAQDLAARPVITAYTDQDGLHVHAIRERPAEQVLREASQRLRSTPAPSALKTGLLPSARAVHAAAELVRLARALLGPSFPVVVDPVLSSSGGEIFLDPAGISALLRELLPLGPILTPNLPELAQLSGHPERELLSSLSRRESAARGLLRLGVRAVVVKGGHAADDPVVDLLVEPDRPTVQLVHPRAIGKRLHGSGCRHASALAAGLARGLDLTEAAGAAGAYVAALWGASSSSATRS